MGDMKKCLLLRPLGLNLSQHLAEISTKYTIFLYLNVVD